MRARLAAIRQPTALAPTRHTRPCAARARQRACARLDAPPTPTPPPAVQRPDPRTALPMFFSHPFLHPQSHICLCAGGHAPLHQAPLGGRSAPAPPAIPTDARPCQGRRGRHLVTLIPVPHSAQQGNTRTRLSTPRKCRHSLGEQFTRANGGRGGAQPRACACARAAPRAAGVRAAARGDEVSGGATYRRPFSQYTRDSPGSFGSGTTAKHASKPSPPAFAPRPGRQSSLSPRGDVGHMTYDT